MATSQLVATPAQEAFIQAVIERGVVKNELRFLAYGGAIGGGKSYALLLTFALLCKLFPGSRWCIVRKDLPTLKRTILQSYHHLRTQLDGFLGPVNQSDWSATCANGSKILFFTESIGEDPDLDRWKGLEVNGFGLEEANELQERSFSKSIERSGRWIIPATKERPHPKQPPPLILLTFNPASNWVRHKFYDPWKRGALRAPFYFQSATVKDNPHLTAEYITNLREMPEAEFRRFVEGDWDAVSGRFFDAVSEPTHLVPRSALPPVIPPHWAMWGGFDWGFRHQAVCGLFAQDTDGNQYLLESVWMHRLSDAEQAERIRTTAVDLGAQRALQTVYAGGDVFNKPQAHGYASPVSVADTLATAGIYAERAYLERVGGWRILRQALQPRVVTAADGTTVTLPPRLRFVDTPNNRRVIETLLSLEPDRSKPEDVQKVDADDQGRGGDDAADCLRYALASRFYADSPPAHTPDYAAERRDSTNLLDLLTERYGGSEDDDQGERPWDDLPAGF